MSNICIKLDINDLEKYLLESDGNVRVEIGNAIVQEFSKRHLKAVAKQFGTEQYKDMLRKELNSYFTNSYPGSVSLSSGMVRAVRSRVHVNLLEGIDEQVKKYGEECNMEEFIADRVKSLVASIVDNEVKRTFGKISGKVSKALHKELGISDKE